MLLKKWIYPETIEDKRNRLIIFTLIWVLSILHLINLIYGVTGRLMNIISGS